jgi:hypothetical protein
MLNVLMCLLAEGTVEFAALDLRWFRGLFETENGERVYMPPGPKHRRRRTSHLLVSTDSYPSIRELTLRDTP